MRSYPLGQLLETKKDSVWSWSTRLHTQLTIRLKRAQHFKEAGRKAGIALESADSYCGMIFMKTERMFHLSHSYWGSHLHSFLRLCLVL